MTHIVLMAVPKIILGGEAKSFWSGGVFGKNMFCGWGSIAPNLVLGVEGSYFEPPAKFFV